ncbi:UDP-N-acetylmuramate--L-alanine ligase [Phaeocystidibacter luteus]|uniref:Peptidoglycan synthetase n=1 Tax=Phaeocystidibacter luteus TaxID=911197 RepID=A0A6N6RMM4_9FLAO|nr:Mur ligase family protein [Phaeocystidibacter luteus]KAB2814815.1 peptidoglycan synthetase [Phaeocystidibacter luteus]
MRVHFIAIGGSAMHNLALALNERGDVVTGSDDEIFEPSKSRLQKAGLLPEKMGWDAERITSDLEAVILGMHAREDNPELLKAKELNIPIYSYPEYLFERTKDKTRVVIAGSHGKTTITSMILHVLHYHDRHEDYMVGAQLEGFDTMVSLEADTDFAVLEGDEYLSSPIDRRPKFHLYHPNIALLSGIAWDHINVFPTFDDYLDQFRIFLTTMERGGALVYNADDPVVKKLVEEDKTEIKKFAYHKPSYRVEGGSCILETPFGDVQLQIIGEHNLLNLEGARWICLEMGIQEDEFYEAIASFTGASKRLEPLAESSNVRVFKDFAHAPSKVKATVSAVAETYPDSKVVACLELHTFSSLNPDFLPGYAGSMDNADEAFVYFNPKAVEHKKLPPLDEEIVSTAFGRSDIQVLTQSDAVLDRLKSEKAESTVYLIMSSGNFDGADLKDWADQLK